MDPADLGSEDTGYTVSILVLDAVPSSEWPRYEYIEQQGRSLFCSITRNYKDSTIYKINYLYLRQTGSVRVSLDITPPLKPIMPGRKSLNRKRCVPLEAFQSKPFFSLLSFYYLTLRGLDTISQKAFQSDINPKTKTQLQHLHLSV